MYFLTDTNQLCLHSSSLPNVAAAKNYAYELQQKWGLCKTFSIGCYKNGKYEKVYDSKREYKQK